MCNEWPRFEVRDLQDKKILLVEDGNHGEYRPRREEFSLTGTAFIRAANMKPGKVEFDSAECINDIALARLRKGIGKPGDILFSHKGTVGKLAPIPDSAPPFVCSPQTTFWRVLDDSTIERRFLYYFMQSERFRNQWFVRKGETDMADYVSLTAQRSFWIEIPPIETQQLIISVLAPLDDKIELNREMNRTLETIAQAMFKSWFVDFDPVEAKAAGKKPAYMSAEIAKLFPSGFEVSDIGPIPRGWKVLPIEDVTSLIIDHRGKTPKKLNSTWAANGIPALSAKNIKAGYIVNKNSIRFVDRSLYEKWMTRPLAQSDVILTSEGPLGELYFLCKEKEYCLSQRLFALRANSQPVTGAYLYMWLSTDIGFRELQNRATGTTVLGIRQSELRKVPVLVPDAKLLASTSHILLSLLEMIHEFTEEASALGQVRDILLPKLMSGEIRIKDAEQLVSEVA